MRHVLQTYLPDRTETAYNLRNRTHNKSLINKTSHLNKRGLYYTNALQRQLLVIALRLFTFLCFFLIFNFNFHLLFRLFCICHLVPMLRLSTFLIIEYVCMYHHFERRRAAYLYYAGLAGRADVFNKKAQLTQKECATAVHV